MIKQGLMLSDVGPYWRQNVLIVVPCFLVSLLACWLVHLRLWLFLLEQPPSSRMPRC